MKKVSLVVVEDHPFTRQTLVYELKKSPNINFLCAFDNGKDVVEYIKINQVDVILMDIDMPIMDGISATKEIKEFDNNISVIMLTNYNEKDKVLSSFKSGANGYCVKQIKIDELLEIIEIVSQGGVWFDKQIAKYVLEIFKTIETQKEQTKNADVDGTSGISAADARLILRASVGLEDPKQWLK